MTDLKQQVAKDLADSGLSKWDDLTWHQSEAIIGDMDLQVVWSSLYNQFAIADFVDDVHQGTQILTYLHVFDRKNRNAANRSALEWLFNQQEWKHKIKAALDRLGWV